MSAARLGNMQFNSLTDEQLLLLRIVGAICNPADDYNYPLVNYASLNARLLLELLSRHGLTALCLDILKRQVKFGFPEERVAQLKNISICQAAIALRKGSHLNQVLIEFWKQGLEVMLLKGPALAMQAYGSDVVRDSNDFDLFIKRRDIEPCCRLLQSLGYNCHPELTVEEAVEFASYENELLFQNQVSCLTVDLHWELSRHYLSRDMNWQLFSKRLVSIDIIGQSVLTLSPEDNIVFLSLHGAKHGWARLEWLCSLGCLIKNNDIDWSAVLDRAEELKALRMLLLACALLQKICRIVPPRALSDHLMKELWLQNLVVMTYNTWFTSYHGTYPLERRVARYHFLLQDNLIESVNYGFRLLFSPTGEDWQKSRNEGSGFWRKALGRPCRLLHQHFK